LAPLVGWIALGGVGAAPGLIVATSGTLRAGRPEGPRREVGCSWIRITPEIDKSEVSARP